MAIEASEVVATRFLRKIEESFQRLLLFPLSGPARNMLAPGLRVTFYGEYAVYYLPAGDELVIVRVLHGARDALAVGQYGGFTEQ